MIILKSLHSNSDTNIVLSEIHVHHLHIDRSDNIRMEKTVILNQLIEAERGGAISDVCLLIFLLVQEILK